MKKTFVIDMQKAMASLEKYKQSPTYLAKIEDARKSYEQDKIWLEPILQLNKQL